MHEDMLFKGGESVTHRKIQVFQVNLGDVVFYNNKVNMTYFILMGPLHEHNTSYGTSICRVHPWTSRESDST